MAAFDLTLIQQIENACRHFDRVRVLDLAAQLADSIRASGLPYPAQDAGTVLELLRHDRYFDAALPLADAILESGQNDPAVRLAYAQALIDTGRLAAAIPLLESLAEHAPPHSKTRNSAVGLIGRAYKQLYVNGAGEPAVREDYLRRAFTAYYDAYTANNALSWHGINAVALLHRARRDKVDLPPVPPFEKPIYDQMKAQVDAGTADDWAMVTAGEAAIALGDYESAKRWYATYAAGDPAKIDAFEIGSSLRQLEEVWQLTKDKSPGAEILPLLNAALLNRAGGAVKIGPESITREVKAAKRAGGEEKTFGDEHVKTIKWYSTGLERCGPICRIERLLDERPFGTGFLVRGEDFCDALEGEMFILTNHHVLPSTMPPEKAFARFQEIDSAKKFLLADVAWENRDLDAALVRLKTAPPKKVKTFPFASQCPAREKNQAKDIPRVYVIGHPLGGPLSISLYDNELVATDGRRLHYRAPTEPGSSGSPVFNEEWELIGLHHYGDWGVQSLYGDGSIYDANEAFWIGAIVDLCKTEIKPAAPPPPARSARPSTRAKKASPRRR